jgi:hypothetical protein
MHMGEVLCQRTLEAFNTNMHSRTHADSFTAPMSTMTAAKHKIQGHLTGLTEHHLLHMHLYFKPADISQPTRLQNLESAASAAGRCPERCGLDAGKLCSAEPYRLIRGVIGVP